MNLVDILIWVVLLIFVVKGFLKGFIKEASALLGFLAGVWAAFKYHHVLANAIWPFIHLPQKIALVLSFIFIFVLLGLLFYLCGYLLTVVCKVMLLGAINRVGGMIFGLLEGAFLLSMVLYFGTAKPVPEKIKGWLGRSSTAQGFICAGREIVSGWENQPSRTKSAGKAK